MIHFLMTISNEKTLMWSQVKYFLQSIKNTNHFVTIVVTGMDTTEFLTEDVLLQNKLKKQHQLNFHNFELLFSGELHKNHPPVRWFVKPVSPMCVFIDSDVIICGSLENLEEPRKCLSGVIAHQSPFSLEQWKSLFADWRIDFPEELYLTNHTKTPCPYYVNYGMICVYKDILKEINERLRHNMNRACQSSLINNFYVGQIVLTLTLEELKIPRETMPLRYNYPDYPCYDDSLPEELENIKVFHYLRNKHLFANKQSLVAYKNHLTPKQQFKIGKIIDQLLEVRCLKLF